MPMSKDFEARLFPILPDVIAHFGTPFHIYDATGILEAGEQVKNVVDQEFLAVKANNNPAILKLMLQMGFGFDCSSEGELLQVRSLGAKPGQIMFTSNNTSRREFEVAVADGGCILNLDDINLIDDVPGKFPDLICFRYNPGRRRTGNEIIGDPFYSKYGVPHEQIVLAYQLAIKRGATRFGLHTMICSNERNYSYMVQTVKMLLEVVEMVQKELGFRFEFINQGGGWGIPYRPEDQPIYLELMAAEMSQLRSDFRAKYNYAPALYLESGRFMTGPHGVLVATCINEKNGYQEIRGLDTSAISSMMRPPMYHAEGGGYHHISVFGKEDALPRQLVQVVGSACENTDRFGWDRLLYLHKGNIVIIHDTGAHCRVMGNLYNFRLPPQELMLLPDGRVELICPAQTIEEYLRRFKFEPQVFQPVRA